MTISKTDLGDVIHDALNHEKDDFRAGDIVADYLCQRSASPDDINTAAGMFHRAVKDHGRGVANVLGPRLTMLSNLALGSLAKPEGEDPPQEQEPLHENGHRDICIKLNNVITNDPCTLCGGRCDPTSVDLFLDGTEQLVCDQCAEKRVPGLYRLLRMADAANAYCYEGKGAEQQSSQHLQEAHQLQSQLESLRRCDLPAALTNFVAHAMGSTDLALKRTACAAAQQWHYGNEGDIPL